MARYLKFNLKRDTLNTQGVKVVCDYKTSYWQELSPSYNKDNKLILSPYGVEVFPFCFVYETKNSRLYEGYYSIDGETFYISHTKSSLTSLNNLVKYNF